MEEAAVQRATQVHPGAQCLKDTWTCTSWEVEGHSVTSQVRSSWTTRLRSPLSGEQLEMMELADWLSLIKEALLPGAFDTEVRGIGNAMRPWLLQKHLRNAGHLQTITLQSSGDSRIHLKIYGKFERKRNGNNNVKRFWKVRLSVWFCSESRSDLWPWTILVIFLFLFYFVFLILSSCFGLFTSCIPPPQWLVSPV